MAPARLHHRLIGRNGGPPGQRRQGLHRAAPGRSMLRVALLSCILISITFSEWPACFILFGPQ